MAGLAFEMTLLQHAWFALVFLSLWLFSAFSCFLCLFSERDRDFDFVTVLPILMERCLPRDPWLAVAWATCLWVVLEVLAYRVMMLPTPRSQKRRKPTS